MIVRFLARFELPSLDPAPVVFKRSQDSNIFLPMPVVSAPRRCAHHRVFDLRSIIHSNELLPAPRTTRRYNRVFLSWCGRDSIVWGGKGNIACGVRSRAVLALYAFLQIRMRLEHNAGHALVKILEGSALKGYAGKLVTRPLLLHNRL